MVTDTIDRLFDEVDVNPAFKLGEMIDNTINMTRQTIMHPDVQALFKPGVKFDLVISEIMLNEAVLGFSEFFACPHILISTVGATSWVDRITNNPSPLSYVPSPFLDLSDKMSLLGRLQNTFFFIFEQSLMSLFYYPKQQEIYETAFPNAKSFLPFWDKMKHGSSLVFLNSHFSVSFPRPYLPNLVKFFQIFSLQLSSWFLILQIEVGGMHIKKKSNPLPDDIQKFINESEHGVVYFSLGGNLNPSVMPAEKQQAIIKALSKLKERVLWKWNDESAIVDRSKFLVKKWFPQDDILADPNVKVFITHGGLLSGTESIYHAKPLVTIPIFGDQKMNAVRTVINGYGVRVDYKNLTESSLSWALNEILSNQKYTIKVKELSERFRDKPQHPVDLAKYYVEYVMKHKGAKFMQSSSTYLNFIELNNLDVYAIIGVLLFFIILIPFYLFKKLLGSIFGPSKVTRKQKKT